ncbi:MAG TPA: FxsA family protein, partial [Mycobacteriales bacterium]
MFVAIVVALIVASLVEIVVIVQIGQLLGAPATLLLLLASAVLGGWLLRREGAKTWRAFTAALTERRPPAVEVVDGVLVLIGGLLMVLPGFVSDVVGLLLVLPPTRRLVRGVVLLRLASRLP